MFRFTCVLVAAVTCITYAVPSDAARPIDGLSKAAAEVFNQCVDDFCTTKLDPDSGVRITVCQESSLGSCCSRARGTCEGSCIPHPDQPDQCGKACGMAERHCSVGTYVTTYSDRPAPDPGSPGWEWPADPLDDDDVPTRADPD